MRAGAGKARLMAGVALAAALALGGCVTVDASYQAQANYTPPPSWANIAGFEDYEWIDRADALSQAVGEAPPDYSFYAGGAEPWAWTFGDGSLLLVEQRPDGLHSYYFEGGSDTPFLVREPDISFGYLDGGVAVVYGPDGTLLDRGEAQGWLYAAMASYSRGRQLRREMIASQERRVVDTVAWIDTSYLFYNWRLDWDEGIQRNPNWRRVRDGVRGRERRHRWEEEHRRRRDQDDRFRHWGQGGFMGRPPGNWTPPPAGTTLPPAGGPPRAGGPGRGPRQPGQPPRAGGPGQPGQPGTGPGRGPRPGDGSGPGRGPGGARPGNAADVDIQPDLGIAPGTTGPGGVGVRRPQPQRPQARPVVTPVPPQVAAPPPVEYPVQGQPPRGGMPRPGSEGGMRPRPERQGDDGAPRGPRPQPVQAPPAPPPAEPVTVSEPVYTPAPPAPPRPTRTPPTSRPAVTPRTLEQDDGPRPQRPAYRAPESQPERSFSQPVQTYSPPPPPPPASYSAPEPSYSPPPAPVRSAPVRSEPVRSAPVRTYSPPPPPPPAPVYVAPPPPPPVHVAPPPPPPPPSVSRSTTSDD